jgi:hypothetical protein
LKFKIWQELGPIKSIGSLMKFPFLSITELLMPEIPFSKRYSDFISGINSLIRSVKALFEKELFHS